jgi:hypothetical protein
MTGKGGFRPGAGRPKGAINKVTEKAREEAERTGITPLQFLLNTMRDEGQEHAIRQDAAKAAAQYIHPKLQAVHTTTKDDADIREWMIAASQEDK